MGFGRCIIIKQREAFQIAASGEDQFDLASLSHIQRALGRCPKQPRCLRIVGLYLDGACAQIGNIEARIIDARDWFFQRKPARKGRELGQIKRPPRSPMARPVSSNVSRMTAI